MVTVANEAGSKGGRRTIANWAAILSLAASITTLVCLAALHVLSPEFDPSWRVVSEYALGGHRWALSLMFLAWATSSWGLALLMSMTAANDSTEAQPPTVPIEDLLRDLIPRVLATVVRRFHDFPGAEDAVQEAALAAAVQWPREGTPDNPHAWLTQVSFRSMADQVRSDSARRRRESDFAVRAAHRPESTHDAPAPQEDDTLVLLFMCCHPALSAASAIALTLRAVGGLTTAEIAKAFFVPEATMAQRISRAKQTIEHSEIPFELPTAAERAQRLRLSCTSCTSSSMKVIQARLEASFAEAICRTRQSAWLGCSTVYNRR